ncbi:MAG: hypothetical protein ACRDGM_18025 [bacterium]
MDVGPSRESIWNELRGSFPNDLRISGAEWNRQYWFDGSEMMDVVSGEMFNTGLLLQVIAALVDRVERLERGFAHAKMR